MHQPPPVSYPFDCGAWPWWFVASALITAAIAALVLGLYQHDMLTLAALAAGNGLVWLVTAIAWRRAAVGHLTWDGSHWWAPALRPGAVDQVFIALDLQNQLLVGLRHDADHYTRWLWLSQRAKPQQWHALRCALVSAVVLPDVNQ